MKHPRQPGFFDVEKRTQKLTAMGDKLVDLKALIDWEAFRPELERVHRKARKSPAGAKPFDVLLMFKILVLQTLHNLSDEGIEYQIRDRLSFMRFLDLQLEDRVPDAKTVWVFRERLKSLSLLEGLFQSFHTQLAALGYEARAGQIVDATFVEVPRQRNKREDNAALKAGQTPVGWDDPARQPMRRQKDVDARWTKKNNQTFFGYKDHVNVDQGHKLIWCYAVTHAAVHDSQKLDELLDTEACLDGHPRPVYADSAYRSQAQQARLAQQDIESQICERGTRDHPLSEDQKATNREKSKVRARVEHVFGSQAQRGGHYVRTIGIARARVKIGLMNLVYNMMRLGQLLKRDGRAVPVGP